MSYNSIFMVFFVGLVYIIIFGGMALLRREGLSLRFALESVFVTIIAAALAAAGANVHPIAFLLVLYLITMRVRFMVELATLYAKRGRFEISERLFALALHIWPDQTNRLIVKVNYGTLLLQQGNLEKSIATFKEILDQQKSGYLGRKYEAATHYNLGIAYLRKNLEAQATVEFNSAIDTLPASVYARRSAQALEQRRHKGSINSS